MEQRQLGTSGLRVSALGLGCMGMSQSYGEADEGESIRTIHAALDAGVTMFDTSDVYGDGANEDLLGRALKHRRDDAVIATKFSVRKYDDGRRVIDGSPENVRRSCEASLTRLKTDHIDLYYQHRVDQSVPIEETVGAMARLVDEGKVRYLGLSEASADTLRRAAGVHPISALESEWSLWTRDIEGEVLGTARKLGIGIVPFSPLGRGFLTGAIKSADDLAADDFRHTSPRFQGNNFTRNLALVAEVETLAADRGCTPAQLALAWVLARGDDVVPIPGTKRQKYLKENLEALSVALAEDDLARLEAVAPRGAAFGDRYGTPHSYGDSRAL